jgi:hypothetical protein
MLRRFKNISSVLVGKSNLVAKSSGDCLLRGDRSIIACIQPEADFSTAIIGGFLFGLFVRA